MDSYSPLTDGTGLQGFALVASEEPLPPYREWSGGRGPLPWRPTGPEAEGVWRFDGRTVEPIGPVTRGVPRKLAGPGPPAFAATCRLLASRPQARAIEAWAFPVRGKTGSERHGPAAISRSGASRPARAGPWKPEVWRCPLADIKFSPVSS